jgi:hypothetical protein
LKSLKAREKHGASIDRLKSYGETSTSFKMWKGKSKMKKFIALQLFAEDTSTNGAANNDNVAAEQGKETNTKEPETATDTGKDVPKYTDSEVDRIVKGKKAEWQRSLEKEREAAEEAKKEAAKLAEMNATQKAEYERDQLQKQLDEYKRKDTLAEMTKTARKMLAEEGINASDELLAVMVTTNAEETKSTVDGFAKLFKDAVENAVKERLRGETPKVGTGKPIISEIDKRIKKYE